MKLTLVVAMARNGVIGRDDDLPWSLPRDLRRFRALTMGHTLLMGRKTHASILARLGHPLPGRTSLVVSRDPDAATRFAHPDCQVFAGLDEALAHARSVPELLVIGGATIYAATLELARRVELTEVHADIEGDTRLPPFDRAHTWREVAREDFGPDDRHAHPHSFVTLDRRGS